MSAAAKRLARLLLVEYAEPDKGVVIDRAAGVIRNVKVLGRQSRNHRTYTEACLKDAAERKVFEGQPVYIDHALLEFLRTGRRRPPVKVNLNQLRPAGERIGSIRNVRLVEGDLRGDLHYLKSHDKAEWLCEAVERGDEFGRLGLSPYQLGRGKKYPDGSQVIHRIEEVRSVDVVDTPATMDSFWEQHDRSSAVAVTLKQYLAAWAAKLSPARKAHVLPLLEMNYAATPMADQDDGDVPPMPDEAPAETEPADAVSGGLEQAVTALVSQCFAGELDAATCLKNIKELFKAHAAVTGQAEPAAPATEQDDDKGDDEKDEEMKEQYDALLSAVAFCEQHDFRPNKRQLELLAKNAAETERLELLEGFQAQAARVRPVRSAPAPAQGTPAPAGDREKQYAERLRLWAGRAPGN